MIVKVDEKYLKELNSIEKSMFEGVLEVIQFFAHEECCTVALLKNTSGHLCECRIDWLVVVEDTQSNDDYNEWRTRAEEAEHILKRGDCFQCSCFRANSLEKVKKGLL